MKQNRILQNKIYLYLTEFFSGMSVMAVELGASRLLAPYFSSSQIVWTIIIGTIMIAMALGNVWGGRSADRDPNPDRLYRRILIAAVWIAAIPVVGKYIILAVSGILIVTVSTNFLIIAAFVSCMVIFVFPLFLLGTVTPSLVKYTVGSLDDSGKTVGTLGAFNTVGSIIGTFLPTFVTIPAVGTAVTFLIFSGILLVLALLYFVAGWLSPHGEGDFGGESSDYQAGDSAVRMNEASGRKPAAPGDRRQVIGCIVAVVLFVLCSIFGNSGSFAFWESSLTYEGESVYNYLQVKETDSTVTLSTNVLFGVQSILMKDDSLTGMYYDYALAAPLMTDLDAAQDDGSLDILVLGMGTGTYATQCLKYFENASVEGVEIDSKIIDLAYEYFEMSDEAEVTAYDGRAYLQAVDETYDVIMVDAYQDITIPFQMSSVEFFTLVREHLTEDGVMVVNLNMRTDEEGSINAYLADTIATVFTEIYTVDVPGYTNRVLFASNNPDMLEQFAGNISALTSDESPVNISVSDIDAASDNSGSSAENSGVTAEEAVQLQELMERVQVNLTEYEAGEYVLTDDKAPVELLGMQVIDAIIEEELGYYKQIFQEEGIEGLLNSF
ncbi:MAG: fused MFS/spermidine synthase [Clostridiales bacterium]|nr:fused MFS/spermidine synthase [Clostridiales bacterium]